MNIHFASLYSNQHQNYILPKRGITKVDICHFDAIIRINPEEMTELVSSLNLYDDLSLASHFIHR